MPWHIVENSSECPASKPYAVVKDTTGDVEGCHATMQDAHDQMAALYANEPMMASQSETKMAAPRDDLIRKGSPASVDGRTMTGYPIVFNSWTVIDSWEGQFKERISPDALTRTLKNNGEQIKVLFNHGMDPSIGDKPLGKPSVMRTDGQGLYVEVPLSDTSYNEDLLALMRDGAIDGMSFRFSVLKEEWNKPNRGLPERTITELRLMELGPVTFPAYQATSVGIRSREDFNEWRGLDDRKRDEIARIMGLATELRTSDTEPGDATSVDELAAEDPTDSPGDSTQTEPHINRHRALAAVARLRGFTNEHQ